MPRDAGGGGATGAGAWSPPVSPGPAVTKSVARNLGVDPRSLALTQPKRGPSNGLVVRDPVGPQLVPARRPASASASRPASAAAARPIVSPEPFGMANAPSMPNRGAGAAAGAAAGVWPTFGQFAASQPYSHLHPDAAAAGSGGRAQAQPAYTDKGFYELVARVEEPADVQGWLFNVYLTEIVPGESVARRTCQLFGHWLRLEAYAIAPVAEKVVDGVTFMGLLEDAQDPPPPPKLSKLQVVELSPS
eukprot:XP_001690510.1 predicted protein [Chlamydomonas reinhardtii]